MTKIVHRALLQPGRSRLRKMSLKTTISSQIQMKKRKNQSIDKNTCPVPNSAAATITLTPPSTRDTSRRWTCDEPGASNGVGPRSKLVEADDDLSFGVPFAEISE